MISMARPATIRRGLALASATVMLLAGPAQAANVNETFHEEEDRVLDCGNGLVLDVHAVNDVRVVGVQRGDGLWYFSEHWDKAQTFTNPATGLALTSRNTGLATKDQTITDNGDGTFTVRTLSPAPLTFYAPDGHKVSHFSGLFVFLFLIDNGGTPQDPNDDEFLDFLGVESAHGRADDLGVCDLAPVYLT